MIRARRKLFSWLTALCLGVTCIFLTVWLADLQPTLAQAVPAGTAVVASSKQELARQVLREMGTAQQYDAYFDHTIGIVISPGQSSKFKTWMREAMAQRAGWKQVETAYVARLVADFSEAELQELLKLARQPVMRKLLRSQQRAYTDTTKVRHQVLYQFWDDYNQNLIPIPSGVL